MENEEKFKLFIKEYGELVEKHKVDLATFPIYVPNDRGGFDTQIQSTPVDISKQPVKSNFMETK